MLKLKVPQMPIIDGFVLSSNRKYLLMRNSQRFFINFTKVIEEKIVENRKNNEAFRNTVY